jgi:uncharacterized protein (DUF305 family)
MMCNRLTGFGVVGLLSVALLTGCSDNTGARQRSDATQPSAEGRQADHNEHDVKFAQQMVPHHQQTLNMVKMLPGRTANPKVADLGRRIEATRDPEINNMIEWLTRWRAALTSTPAPGALNTAEQLFKLTETHGAGFDRTWLDIMVRHQQGTVGIAEAELSKGANADARKLAEYIISSTRAEIAEMQALLESS